MIMAEVLNREVPFDEYLREGQFCRPQADNQGVVSPNPDVHAIRDHIVNAGLRPSIRQCSTNLRELIQQCWGVKRERRPTFVECEKVLLGVIRSFSNERVNTTDMAEELMYQSFTLEEPLPDLRPRRHPSQSSESMEVNPLLNLSTACYVDVHVSCVEFCEDLAHAIVGTDRGQVILAALDPPSLLCSCFPFDARVVFISSTVGLFWCISEDGWLAIIRGCDFDVVVTWRIEEGLVSPCFFSGMDLWVCMPNSGRISVWPLFNIVAALNDESLTEDQIRTRLNNLSPMGFVITRHERRGVRVEIQRKKTKLAANQTPFPVTAFLTTHSRTTIVASKQAIVAINTKTHESFLSILSSLGGTITCLHSHGDEIWIGNDLGEIVFLKGSDIRAGPVLSGRIISITDVGPERLSASFVDMFSSGSTKTVLTNGCINFIDPATRVIVHEITLGPSFVCRALIVSGTCLLVVDRTGRVCNITPNSTPRRQGVARRALPRIESILADSSYSTAWHLLKYMMLHAGRLAEVEGVQSLKDMLKKSDLTSGRALLLRIFRAYRSEYKLLQLLRLIRGLEEMNRLVYFYDSNSTDSQGTPLEWSTQREKIMVTVKEEIEHVLAAMTHGSLPNFLLEM